MPANPKKTTPNTRRMVNLARTRPGRRRRVRHPPPPRPSNGWGPSKPSWASAMATASPRAGHRLPAISRRAGILRLSEGSARMDAERRGKARARTPGVAMCSTMRSAAPARGSARLIGCADENVGEVDALREAGGYFALFCGHDHKNSSLVMCMISIWAMHPRAGSNAMVPSRVPRHSPV